MENMYDTRARVAFAYEDFLYAAYAYTAGLYDWHITMAHADGSICTTEDCVTFSGA